MNGETPTPSLQQAHQEAPQKKYKFYYYIGKGGLAAITLLVLAYLLSAAQIFLASVLISRIIEIILFIIVSFIYGRVYSKLSFMCIIWMGILYVVIASLIFYPARVVGLGLYINLILYAFVPIVVGGYIGRLSVKRK